MTLREIKRRIDFIASQKDGKFLDYDVVVTLADKDIAGRAFSPVTNILLGSGTEYKQIRIDLKDEVCVKGRSKKDGQKLVPKGKGRFGKQKYRCPRCGAGVDVGVAYCSHCGQRVFVEKRGKDS